jgi:transcriptional regulator with XRE-family HTH domain
MDHQSEVCDFLTTRRARLNPDQVGLPHFAGRRRVPGLRREEVAMLTGVSTEYYARLERGHLAGVSDQVLDALARALRLDESERAHLLDLARAAAPAQRPPRATPRRTPRPGLQRLLDAMDSTPAYVRTGHLDIVAANRLGRALFSDIFTTPESRPNLTRYIFLDPRARDFYREWDTVARDIVAAMRSEAGRNPHDRTLSNLVGELSTRSDEFRTWWADHEVRTHHSPRKLVHHPVAGDLDFDGEGLLLPDDTGLTLIAYTYEPASPTAEGVQFLSSWANDHMATASAR